jgi:hypothetical protein
MPIPLHRRSVFPAKVGLLSIAAFGPSLGQTSAPGSASAIGPVEARVIAAEA